MKKTMAEVLASRNPVWVLDSASSAYGSEKAFFDVMDVYFKEILKTDKFSVEKKPRNLKGVYGLTEKGSAHGIEPDFSLLNDETGKSIFVEIKNQKNESGNAHERLCKYWTPGLLKSLREVSNQGDDVCPFWGILSGGIAQNANYRQEVRHWFYGYEGNIMFWENTLNYKIIIDHFNNNIRELLE